MTRYGTFLKYTQQAVALVVHPRKCPTWRACPEVPVRPATALAPGLQAALDQPA
eukprot:gene1666-11876_t